MSSHLGLYNYPMGGAAALFSRSHHRDFLFTETKYQKPGGGEGIDWNRNWQRHEELGALKNSQIILDDWTTFEITIQDRHWTQQAKVTATDAISLHCNELNIDEIQALRQIYFYLLEYCFLLVVTIGSEHRQNKRITSTLQKQINEKILKEQTKPQTYTLVHESHPRGITLPRMYDNSRKSPSFKSDFDRLSPVI